jgi:hypothetical protein
MVADGEGMEEADGEVMEVVEVVMEEGVAEGMVGAAVVETAVVEMETQFD